MGRRSVVVTGIGMTTALGARFPAFSDAVLAGHARFQAVTTRHVQPLPGARVDGEDAVVPRSDAALTDRSTHFAVLAAGRALDDAGWLPGDPMGARCGVFVGCASGPTESLQASYASLHEPGGRVPRLTLLRCLPCAPASAIGMRYRLRGPTQTSTSACASSTLAIGEAMRAIRHGYLDVAVVGGTEAPFGDGALKAWDTMRVLAPLDGDPADACRPFDRHRRGIVLGEGAVFFVIESAAHAAARGAAAYAEIAGFASGGDGHHWTEPSAEGQVNTMRAALADAGLRPQHVGAVNAYGNATPLGDRVEAASIVSLFGTGSSAPWVTSTKATHGHLLGASGAIEMAASIASLQSGRVPVTRNFREGDAESALRVACAVAPRLPEDSAVLSSSFAYGGSNACLVLTPVPGICAAR